jgi:hypothetical protein
VNAQQLKGHLRQPAPPITVEDVAIHAQALATRTGFPAYVYRSGPDVLVCSTEEPNGRRKPLAVHLPPPRKLR